jgi:hypothetical protein
MKTCFCGTCQNPWPSVALPGWTASSEAGCAVFVCTLQCRDMDGD